MPERYTVGVEEEYQLVDSRSGELRSRAREVLAADWAAELQTEVQETMLEVGSPVCASAGELGAELRRLRFLVGSVAATEELRFVAAGLHPFSHWRAQQRSGGDRYAALAERYGRILRTEHLFGMHVHVAVPERVDRAVLCNRVRPYLAHLLALSASSPWFEGEDTGFHSYRTVLWRRMSLTGPPPRLGSEAEYWRYTELLCASGAALDQATVYWSLRPHPRYPTLEFRCADVCPRVEDAVAIAALARALVVAAAEGRLREPRGWLPDSALHELLTSNEWHAARYGLDARVADPAGEGSALSMRDAVRHLTDRLRPTVEALGDEAELRGVETILERGSAADRIRAAAARTAAPRELVHWLAEESLLGTGLDRRGEQRGVLA